jgi:hypothetical protein
MATLQESFDDGLDRIPLLAIEKIIVEKLAAAEIEDIAFARRVAEALVASKGRSVTIDSPYDILLNFTDDDMKRVEEATAAFLERLPDLVDELAEDTTQRLVDGMRQQWNESRPLVDEAAKLRERIAKDWGGALDALRLLVHLCAQEGEKFNFAQMESKLKRGAERNGALARLHIRACRIAEEIILLIENGHTEGAQGRWRTLHEVTVTATLIAAGGDALAERYFAHEAVERKKVLDDHRRAATSMGAASVTRKQADAIERDCAAAVRKYGRHFQGMYGWAGGVLGPPDSPQFHNLQEVAGSLAEKLRFRLACFDTHASLQTLSQPVHYWDPTIHVSGTFSAGFEGPIADTAQTIAQITLLLLPEPWDLDRIVLVRALARLRDELIDDAYRIAKRIEKDEQRSIERAMRRPGRPLGYVKRKPVRR